MPYEMILRERHFPLLFSTAVVGCVASVWSAIVLGVDEYEPSSLNETCLRIDDLSSKTVSAMHIPFL